MIEIKIKIEEKEAKEIKNKLAKRIECEITQEGKNYTKGEKEVADIIEDRLHIKNNIEIIDKTKKKEVDLEELLNKLFSL